MAELIRSTRGLGPIQSIEIGKWPLRSGKSREIDDDVHIWYLSRSQYQPPVSRLLSYLSLWEQKKAMSFSYAKDREDYILGRGVLRHLLSQYLGKHPSEIEISSNRHGKPLLSGEGEGLNFNVSQSANLQVFCFTQKRQIGIDIELIDTDVKMDELMVQNFSASELREIRELPEYEQVYSFYKTWTQKEAYLKARGKGYELSSKSFCVDTDPKRESGLVATTPKEKVSPFKIYQIPLLRGFSCSVAVEAPLPSHVRTFKVI